MKKTTVALCVIALLGVYYSAWPRTVTVVVGRGATSSAVTRTDTFDALGTENPLVTNWTTITGFGAMMATNGVATGTDVAGAFGAYWDADSFAANQYSQVEATGSNVGVVVRVNGTSMYLFRRTTGGTFQMLKDPGGTQLGADYTSVSFTDGQVIRLEATGTSTTTLTPIVNGVTLATREDSSSAIESGGVGIYCGSNINNSSVDDWSGGEL